MGNEELNQLKCKDCGHIDTERFDIYGYCDVVGFFIEKEQGACMSHTGINKPQKTIGFKY